MNDLNIRDWDKVMEEAKSKKRRRRFFKTHRSREIQRALDQSDACKVSETPGKVDVIGLGFITNMADFMVAADVLVTKAGPGTIAEAAAVGLPIMLTR
jgi:1,2-diacylglycerol 3-beta-galactosyltransferase